MYDFSSRKMQKSRYSSAPCGHRYPSAHWLDGGHCNREDPYDQTARKRRGRRSTTHASASRRGRDDTWHEERASIVPLRREMPAGEPTGLWAPADNLRTSWHAIHWAMITNSSNGFFFSFTLFFIFICSLQEKRSIVGLLKEAPRKREIDGGKY